MPCAWNVSFIFRLCTPDVKLRLFEISKEVKQSNIGSLRRQEDLVCTRRHRTPCALDRSSSTCFSLINGEHQQNWTSLLREKTEPIICPSEILLMPCALSLRIHKIQTSIDSYCLFLLLDNVAHVDNTKWLLVVFFPLVYRDSCANWMNEKERNPIEVH